MGQPVVHFEISSKDYKKAVSFFRNLFGWDIQDIPQMSYGMVRSEGPGAIGGGIGQIHGDNAPVVTFYVQVDNLQAYLDKAVALGGKTIVPPTPIPNIGSFAMFADLDGNLIGLFRDKE